jgi:Fic family protein/DNA-binding XRE family transcriptional regulator
MDFQQKLKLIQKYSHKTQTEIATALGVSFSTINSWINKKSQPRQGALLKIDALYIEYVGDLDIDNSVLVEKQKRLNVLKKHHKNPLTLILSRSDIYDSFLLEMTHHTNGIEGSTFNEPEVKAVLFDDVTVPNKTVLEHQEAKNHQAAFGFVMRWMRDKNGKITESLIKRVHEILMNGIMHNAGQYRTHKVRITGSLVVTSNPLSIEKNMRSLIKELNTPAKDIVMHIAKTHALFELIHPFSDGNGRIGRLLMLILAFRNNLAPVLVEKEKKLAYYNCLQESQTKSNHLPLTSFIYDATLKGYELLE